MSSYFVNSFSGRYPNGPDYQLLNYGTSSNAMNGTYRDTGTMHSGSYGYNYNGMDLSVNRSATSSHFGAVGESSGSFQSPAQENRFRQPSSCSLSSPESLPCSNSETLGPKCSSPPSDQPANPGIISNNSSSSSTSKNCTGAHFTELDETSASSETDEGSLRSGNSIPRVQQHQQPQEGAASSTTPTSEGQPPQIFPWMRKLHINHEYGSLRESTGKEVPDRKSVAFPDECKTASSAFRTPTAAGNATDSRVRNSPKRVANLKRQN
ncbi:Homeobox protein Hox-B5a [Acipenser ruthenus]|uniref:Homeobox protein Hox-B5a n=1 Tax=Acipenser ruthenus TaxID=7906 RepID=A0A444UHY6_ACIRT|nr:Homeobox protein Hox-B5a [Acipenser ruthenus]